MVGWSRTPPNSPVNAGAFWLRYGLCLAQILVIVAYFLPWERVYADFTYEGLVSWVYSRLTHDPSTHQAFFMVSLIICFMAAIISFLLTVFMLAMKRGHVLALRASSLLTSLAVVGPLLYIHKWLSWPIGSDLSDLSPAIGEMAIGWFIALFSGSAACVLALYLYHEACESSRTDCDSREHPPAKPYGAPLSLASIFIVTFGAVITVTGFFLTWNSGSASTIMGQDSWSNNGFEVSPLMYLVPVAGVVSCALLILNLFVRETRSPVFLQATQNLLIVTLALTLFWGVAFGEFRSIGVGMVFAAKLSFGWYLCVIGLSIMLVSLFLHQRFRSTASGSRKIWRSKSTSR